MASLYVDYKFFHHMKPAAFAIRGDFLQSFKYQHVQSYLLIKIIV